MLHLFKHILCVSISIIMQLTIGNESLHNISNDDGVINFATSKNSKSNVHLVMEKLTIRLPILIDRWHHSTLRGGIIISGTVAAIYIAVVVTQRNSRLQY
jgi:hypothetical protein